MNTIEKLNILVKKQPENAFYESLHRQYKEKGKLSEKQLQYINKDYNEYLECIGYMVKLDVIISKLRDKPTFNLTFVKNIRERIDKYWNITRKQKEAVDFIISSYKL